MPFYLSAVQSVHLSKCVHTVYLPWFLMRLDGEMIPPRINYANVFKYSVLFCKFPYCIVLLSVTMLILYWKHVSIQYHREWDGSRHLYFYLYIHVQCPSSSVAYKTMYNYCQLVCTSRKRAFLNRVSDRGGLGPFVQSQKYATHALESWRCTELQLRCFLRFSSSHKRDPSEVISPCRHASAISLGGRSSEETRVQNIHSRWDPS
jgi:hypothetical protein